MSNHTESSAFSPDVSLVPSQTGTGRECKIYLQLKHEAHYHFFFKLVILKIISYLFSPCLEDRETERQRETQGQREIFHQLVHLPNNSSGGSWVRPEPGVQNSAGAPHVGSKNTTTRRSSWCLPGCSSLGSRSGKLSCDLNPCTLVLDVAIPSSVLTTVPKACLRTLFSYLMYNSAIYN